MKNFIHYNAQSIDEATTLLQRYGAKAKIIAGGTDLLGKMKDYILPEYPEALINIKTIGTLDRITIDGGSLKIGALAKLADVAHNPEILRTWTALAEAAGRTASPNLREMGTIGGNICQDIRCWYYRNQNNRFSCLRKGGGRCYAIKGDNRYHSIFGGSVEMGCYAVHPSDIAPALVALDAKIITNKKTIKADNFFTVGPMRTTVLEFDEFVTEIQIPEPAKGTKSSFIKYAMRKSIDFPLVNCATMTVVANGTVSAARICLNGVYVVPYRCIDGEHSVLNKPVSEKLAESAGTAGIAAAKPMSMNSAQVQVAKTLITRTLCNCLKS